MQNKRKRKMLIMKKKRREQRGDWRREWKGVHWY